jgi:hypothetical protein
VVPFEQVRRVVGTDLSGTPVTIEPYHHHLTADAVCSPPLPEGATHPTYAWHAAMAGLSVSVDELFALVHATAADGPMLGEADIEVREPLRLGATYAVHARLADAQRKSGERTGTFDVVAVRIELRDDAGGTAAVVTNRFVFPRRPAAL